MSANIEHNFYCIKCGNRGIPLQRRKSLTKEKFHRKKLYCIYCKEEVNHAEVKNDYEVQEFKEAFINGYFLKELEGMVL